MIGGVRGSHVVLPRFPGAPASAVYTEAADGRAVFLVPWNGQLLFGTTEVRDDDDPSNARPSADEIRYLVSSLRSMWPRANAATINYAFAGVRPLPRVEGKDASAITRRHFLRDHATDGAQGLISVIGGKLTTAASLARQCARKIGVQVAEPAVPRGFVDGGAFDRLLDQFAHDVAQIARITPEQSRALVHWHGGEAIHIARSISTDARCRKPIAAGTHHIVGEALWSVEQEAAVTLADILLRRVPLALGCDWSEARTREAARNLGTVLGWNEGRVAAEIEAFEEERSAFLIRPAAGRIAA